MEELKKIESRMAEINTELEDSPEMLNEDPYGAWLIKVENVTGTEELLDAEGYAAVVEAEEA